MTLDLMEILATQPVSVFVNQTIQAKNVINARMVIMTGQAVPIVNVIFTEPNRKFVIKIQENVCVKMDTDRHVVIVAYLDFSIIRSVYIATVQQPVQSQPHATTVENVLAFKTLLVRDAISVWQDFINSLSAYHVTVILMVQMVLLVITTANVIVNITLMVKLATLVKRISTTIHFARAVIVIPRELLLNLLVVAQYPLVNSVSVKSEHKEEFAINVAHFIGI